jgi:hypothetical protein
MAQTKQALSGAEALQILESSASIDLKRARQLVEEAATADIASYFKGADLGEISPSLNSTLVSAAIAGGQWGFNSLVSRLSSSNVHEADYEHVANEILEIVSPLTKVLNYARFRTGAIQSYVAQCDVPSFKLQTMMISKADLTEYESRIQEIKKTKISDDNSLLNWGYEVDELCEFLSNTQMNNADAGENLASRSKKGTVSTKSISSYSKHWHSYMSEILAPELGIRWRGDKDDSIATRTTYLDGYKVRSWSQIQKDLKESVSSRRIFKSNSKTIRKPNTGGKVITDVRDLGASTLRITYTLPGIDHDLITPAINLLRGQMIRNPKAPVISVKLESEAGSLAVELQKPSKIDFADVEIHLNSYL